MSSDEENNIVIKLPIKQLQYTIGKKDEKNLVFHYFADNLTEDEIQNAKIILFAGKTGSGKTTAINALVNIIKGVKNGDLFRYNLIEEKPKAKGQAESQTDGIHLYYLKDYQNNPLIIIDSQGYGDTRGFKKDLDINKAFQYAFSHVIDHINIICLTVQSDSLRNDSLITYIYTSVTSLFANDIADNFIVLVTFANEHDYRQPKIIKSILENENSEFLQVKNTKKEKNSGILFVV